MQISTHIYNFLQNLNKVEFVCRSMLFKNEEGAIKTMTNNSGGKHGGISNHL